MHSVATSASLKPWVLVKTKTVHKEGAERIKNVSDEGRRGMLLSTLAAATLANDSRTQLLRKYLEKSEENKAKNDKERMDSYYKRNYKDYFELLGGNLKEKKGDLSESEKAILEWLEKNK